jgi:membrane associated rhomboid family serine protease/Flp pilus assembly protein TadD
MIHCASCGREFPASSDAESICPQCAAELHQPPAPPSAPLRSQRLFDSPTFVIVALNVLIYLAMAIENRGLTAFDANLLQSWGANSGALTSGGQWWRLLTSTFLHGTLMHLFFNMWCLYSLGWLAELLFGRSRFTLLYLLCGVGGSLGSICWRGSGLSVGASGAIFGIAAALIPVILFAGNPQLRRALNRNVLTILIFLAYSLWVGANSRSTDNGAHIGGLLTGLLLGAIFPSGITSRERSGRLRVAAGTALILVLFTAAAFFAAHRNVAYIEIQRATDAHDRGDLTSAVAHAQNAVRLKPESADWQFMLGTLLLDQKHYDQAVEPFATAIRLQPNSGPAYVNLCLAQRELKLLKDALANCEQGVRLLPQDSESWFNLGHVRYDLNDLPGARDALSKAAALNPNGFDENFQYALILIATEDSADAVPYLEKAHSLRPSDDEVERLLRQLRGAR